MSRTRHPSWRRSCLVSLAALTVLSLGTREPRLALGQETRGHVALQRELDDLELKGTWYYDDWKGAEAEARRTGKPLFVVLRCPP